MAPWCIHISCLERVARSGSGRDSVRGLVGAMDAELSRPDWFATVQSGRKQVQSRVCTPSFMLRTGARGAPCGGACGARRRLKYKPTLKVGLYFRRHTMRRFAALAGAFRLASTCASVAVKSINPRAYKTWQKLNDCQYILYIII